MKPIPAADISDGVLAISGDLSASVTRNLARDLSKSVKAIAADLRAGHFEEAKAIARDLTFTDGLEKSAKVLQKFARATALLGAGGVDRPSTSIMANGAGFPFEVDKSAPRLLSNMISHILTRDTRRRVLDRINRAERFQKAADPIDPDKLAKDINRFLRGDIRRVVDVSANIVGTRLAAYGLYYEARARGISKYRIDAVIDDRTTDICRNLDGRVFEVEFAFNKTGTLLNTTDPAEQKKLAPFPELDQIRGLSNEELQAQGHDTPPFHFLCRSVVTLIGTDREYDPVEYSKFPTEAPELSNDDIDDFFDRMLPITLKSIGAKSIRELEDLKNKAAPLTDPSEVSGPLAKVVATEAYTGNAFNGINTTLRNHSHWQSPEQREIARTLDKAIEDAPALKDDMVVYRGTTGKVYDQLSQIGKVFQDDGFGSATIAPQTAQQWGRADAVLQILVPAGQKALPLGELSLTKYEAEVLLPRSMQFRVVGIDENVPFGGTTRRVIRVVMQGTNRQPDLDNLPDFEEFIESLVKAETRYQAKFFYELGDLREASLTG